MMTNRYPKNRDSFVYEDLVLRVSNLQNSIVQSNKILDNQWENQKKELQDLKSRSFTFIDPYGNRTSVKFMDHELILTILKKYKKTYVPKYLQKWIKFGTYDTDKIVPLTNCERIRLVSEYADGSVFVTYGDVSVWMQSSECSTLEEFTFNIRLTDNISNIKSRLEDSVKFIAIEMKSCFVENGGKPTQNNIKGATPLKLEDTILSAQLYEQNSKIIAKIIQDTSNDDNTWTIYVKQLTGTTLSFLVHPYTTTKTIKQLIEDKTGSAVDQQQIIFANQRLEDNYTLKKYNIRNESTVHVVLRLRGGMYHLTSGRINFDELPGDMYTPIAEIMSIQWKNAHQINGRTTSELQTSVHRAQGALSNFFRQFKEVSILEETPNLRNILHNMINDNEIISDDDDDDSEND